MPRMVGRRPLILGGGAALAIGWPAMMPARSEGASVAPVRIGVLHSVTGDLANEGAAARAGALLALEEINAAGGIASLGGARLEAVLGDAGSRAEQGAAEVDKMAEADVTAIIGPGATAIALATTAAAERHGIAHLIDTAVADPLVQRGLRNTFRFAPGAGRIATIAMENLARMNDMAGRPLRHLAIIHEETIQRTALARSAREAAIRLGFEVDELMQLGEGELLTGRPLASPIQPPDVARIVQRLRSVGEPDGFVFSLSSSHVMPIVSALQKGLPDIKMMQAILGGIGSSRASLREAPSSVEYLFDCGNWFNPKLPRSRRFQVLMAAHAVPLTAEAMVNYSCMLLLAEALERASSTERTRVVDAVRTSTFSDHIMPYGPTRFVGGQNEGAVPTTLQLQGGRMEVILPGEAATMPPVFPRPRL